MKKQSIAGLLAVCLAVSAVFDLVPGGIAQASSTGVRQEQAAEITPLQPEKVSENEPAEEVGSGPKEQAVSQASENEPAAETEPESAGDEALTRPGGYVQIPFDMQPVETGACEGVGAYGQGLPSAWDNRQRLPAVRDQGLYGTCWAFAAMAAAEGGLIFQKKQVDGKVADQSIDLSEYQVARFTYFHVDDPLRNTTGDKMLIRVGQTVLNGTEPVDSGRSYLQLGGNNMLTTWALAGWKGGADETAAPYSSIAATRGILHDTVAYQNKVHMQNAYWILLGQTDLVKQMIMQYGAVAGAYKDYSKGHYEEKSSYYSGALWNSPLVAKYFTGHAIAIVGWDDQYSRENFDPENQPDIDGAWLVRNSWGDWGDDGYFWLSYQEPTLEERVMVFDFEDADNYDYNYQYDGSCGMQSRQVGVGGSMANVFQLKGEGAQLLEAVSIGMSSTNTPYSVQIYQDPKPGNPTSGTPLLFTPQKGEFVYVGYHTIKLQQPVLLKPGHSFSVVFTFKDGARVFLDTSYTEGGGVFQFVSSTNSGQSYQLETGMSSVDLHSYNACARIKAFTNRAASGDGSQVTKASPGKDGTLAAKKNGTTLYEKKIRQPSKIKLSKTEYTCNGKVNYPKVKGVYDKDGKAIDPAHYTVTYSNPKSAAPGTYQVTVKFRGNFYQGSLKADYKIKIDAVKKPKVSAQTASLKLSWAKNSKASGYQVYVATSASGKYRKVATVKGSSARSYTYKKAKSKTTYYFKVRAYRKSGSKTYTGPFSEVAAGAVKPGKVNALKAKASGKNSVKLSWNKTAGASGYQIYVYNKAKKKYQKAASVSKGSTVSKKLSSLKRNTTYQYKVRAYRKVGKTTLYGAFSAPVKVKTKSK